MELYKARQAIRPVQEKAAEKQLEETLRNKPSFGLLLNAKQEMSRLLGENEEEWRAKQFVKQQRKAQQNTLKKQHDFMR